MQLNDLLHQEETTCHLDLIYISKMLVDKITSTKKDHTFLVFMGLQKKQLLSGNQRCFPQFQQHVMKLFRNKHLNLCDKKEHKGD